MIIAFLPLVMTAGPIEDLQPGRWYEIPNSAENSVRPADGQFPWTNVAFFACGIDCWVSGAYDSRRDRIYIGAAGGHGSYWGNEVYAFSMVDLSWSRLNDPSPTPYGHNTDWGEPSATHTYDAVEYLPNVDRFLVMGGANSHGYAGDYSEGLATYLFDPLALGWERNAVPPGTGATDSRTGAISAYDPVSGLFFYHRCFTSGLASFAPESGIWRSYGANFFLTNRYTGTIDPVRRRFVAVGIADEAVGGGGETVVWDISDPSAADIAPAQLTTTGDVEVEATLNVGIEYDPVSDTLVAWRGGTDVYTLDLDTSVWTRVAAAAGNTVTPTAPNVNGTFGLFRYVPSMNVFVLVNRSRDNVFVYKLTAATSAPQWYLDLLGTPGDTVAPQRPVNLRVQ